MGAALELKEKKSRNGILAQIPVTLEAPITAQLPGSLSNPAKRNIARAIFGENPDQLEQKTAEVKEALAEMEKSWGAGMLVVFENPYAAKALAADPASTLKNFRIIAAKSGKFAENPIPELAGANAGMMYALHTTKFMGAVNEAGTGCFAFINSLRLEEPLKSFMDYVKTNIDLETFLLPRLDSFVNREAGKELDRLHYNEAERKRYLNGLSKTQVLALLLMDPGDFYTSTNNLLFDRLKKDLGGKPIGEALKKHGLLGTDKCRNLMFRAIAYDRFYGRANSLFSDDDMKLTLDTLLSPLQSGKFNPTYYYLLANSFEKISKISIVNTSLDIRLFKLLKGMDKQCPVFQDDALEMKKVRYALECLAYAGNQNTPLVRDELKNEIECIREKGNFDRSLYSVNGKLRVIQIFNKEDTGKDHWPATKARFLAKAGNEPVKGKLGELTYELKNATVTLFMGKDDEENQAFIRSTLSENPNGVFTFRGHSYSLLGSFPFDVFRDNGNILFIPGSCGSSGSIPGYVEANEHMSLGLITTPNIGRGEVTNTIVEALIDAKEPKKFTDIIKEKSSRITASGGDIESIRMWDLGEVLLNYVNSGMSGQLAY